jgi:hypothetical protein
MAGISLRGVRDLTICCVRSRWQSVVRALAPGYDPVLVVRNRQQTAFEHSGTG